MSTTQTVLDLDQVCVNTMRTLAIDAIQQEIAKGLRAQPKIDGFLVGGASLDPVSFASIVNA